MSPVPPTDPEVGADTAGFGDHEGARATFHTDSGLRGGPLPVPVQFGRSRGENT